MRFDIGGSTVNSVTGDTAGSRRSSSMGAASYGMPSNTSDGQYYLQQVSLNYLDSPSTTSATTYKVQISPMRTSTKIATVNRAYSRGDDNQLNTASTITLMEIAQ